MPEENRPPRPVLAGRHSCAPRKSQVYHHGVHHLFRRVRQGFRPQGVQVCQAVRAMRRDSFLLLCVSVVRRRSGTACRVESSDRCARIATAGGTPGSRSRVGSSSGRDTNDATVWDVTRGVREERKSSLTRIARGTPRGDARRRRSVSTVRGIRIGVRSRSRTDRDDMRLAKPTARDPGRGVFPGSVTRNEWWILFLV